MFAWSHVQTNKGMLIQGLMSLASEHLNEICISDETKKQPYPRHLLVQYNNKCTKIEWNQANYWPEMKIQDGSLVAILDF